MPAFQNYYQPMQMFNQPIQQNPYMDRLQQLQQYQQNIQQTLGKIVESIDIVKATDIPMDGNMYYFPKADGTEIYSKQWLNNGQTQILTFKPILDNQTEIPIENNNNVDYNAINDVLQGIQNDIQVLNGKIDEISKTKTTKSKKEE